MVSFLRMSSVIGTWQRWRIFGGRWGTSRHSRWSRGRRLETSGPKGLISLDLPRINSVSKMGPISKYLWLRLVVCRMPCLEIVQIHLWTLNLRTRSISQSSVPIPVIQFGMRTLFLKSIEVQIQLWLMSWIEILSSRMPSLVGWFLIWVVIDGRSMLSNSMNWREKTLEMKGRERLSWGYSMSTQELTIMIRWQLVSKMNWIRNTMRNLS